MACHPINSEERKLFADAFSLIVEGTLFSVAFGYVVPEGLRIAQEKADRERWDPAREAINSKINDAIAFELRQMETSNTIVFGDEWK